MEFHADLRDLRQNPIRASGKHSDLGPLNIDFEKVHSGQLELPEQVRERAHPHLDRFYSRWRVPHERAGERV